MANTITLGLGRIATWLFGPPGPSRGLATQQPSQVPNKGSLYPYSEGLVFLPNTGNQIMQPAFDGPVFTPEWGNGMCRYFNTFNPIQPPPLVSLQAVTTAGLGGLQAGSLYNQPLTDSPSGNGSEAGQFVVTFEGMT